MGISCLLTEMYGFELEATMNRSLIGEAVAIATVWLSYTIWAPNPATLVDIFIWIILRPRNMVEQDIMEKALILAEEYRIKIVKHGDCGTRAKFR